MIISEDVLIFACLPGYCLHTHEGTRNDSLFSGNWCLAVFQSQLLPPRPMVHATTGEPVPFEKIDYSAGTGWKEKMDPELMIATERNRSNDAGAKSLVKSARSLPSCAPNICLISP